MRNSGSAIHTLCVVLCSFWISRKMLQVTLRNGQIMAEQEVAACALGKRVRFLLLAY